jgi:hypothetical protein
VALRVPVNAEKLVMDHIRSFTEFNDIAEERMFTVLPAEPADKLPLGVVHRVAGNLSVNEHLDSARLQLESWAEKGGRPTAENLMETMRAIMGTDNIVGVHDLGVVTGSVELFMYYAPDPLTARPRYISDWIIFVHPLRVEAEEP